MTASPLPRATSRPAAASHRGASRAAPENTMEAFRIAWDAGVPWTETDTQPSVDDVPVLIHDDDVDRTTDGTGTVRDFRALDLRALDAGAWFGADFAGARIPELQEFLQAMPADHRVFLEIKGPHTPEQLVATLDVVRAAGVDDRVFVQSFEREALAAVQQIQPGRPLGLLTAEWDEDPVAACRALGAVSYHPHHRLLLARPDPSAEVAALHAAGMTVAVWTADERSDWDALAAIGVDAIMSNEPMALLEWTRER
ncbi:glycerophosphodiester phosphodiesterase family protein [Nakamurella sp. A5-74]|uniref:Glycerophosphodiester phosphodiesterase family protein n=1 Tax=Nakamurella sp. A5-74 TaxID=3158264 RepID=A0AAU8DK92_9ACTN